MVEYLFGSDTYGAREYIDAVAKEQKADITWLDREQLEEQPLSYYLSQGSGLFGRHLYVVRDPGQFPKSLQEDITQIIKNESGFIWLLWDRIAPDKRSSLFQALRSVAKEFPFLSADQLTVWLTEIAKKESGSLDRPAAQELVRLTGFDRWRLTSELQRLLLLHPVLTVEVVRSSLPSTTVETTIFAMLDGIIARNPKTTLTSLETLLQQGESEFYILSMLAYQFRTVGFVRSGLDQQLPVNAIAKEYGLKPFVVQKSMRAAQQASLAAISTTLARITATDFAIKQGKTDARTGVTMLVTALAQGT